MPAEKLWPNQAEEEGPGEVVVEPLQVASLLRPAEAAVEPLQQAEQHRLATVPANWRSQKQSRLTMGHHLAVKQTGSFCCVSAWLCAQQDWGPKQATDCVAC